MTAMTIRARDVRTLLQLSDPWHRSEPVESVWESALSTIKALIPCDAVSFPIQDVAHGGCVSREFTDKYETYLDPGACSDDAPYWHLFWSVIAATHNDPATTSPSRDRLTSNPGARS